MNKGGRKASLDWNHVDRNSEGSVICKYCQCKISPKIERIRKHLDQCTEKKKAEELIDIDSDMENGKEGR